MDDFEGMAKHQVEEARDRHYRKAEKIIERAEREGRSELRPSERRRFNNHLEQFEAAKEELRLREPAREPVARGAFDDEYEGGDMEDRSGGNRVFEVTTKQRDELRDWMDPDAETRAGIQSIGTAGEGGRLASTIVGGFLFRAMDKRGGLRATRARRIRTETGEDMKVPGLADVANLGSQVEEGSTIANTTNLVFSEVNLPVFTYQAGPVAASVEVLQDANFELEDIIEDSLGARLSRRTAVEYAGSTATSSTAVNGVVTATSGAVSVASGATNLTLDPVLDLYYSVDPLHRQDGEWIMTDKAFQQINTLTDGNGQPLLNESFEDGPSRQLQGAPVHVVEDLGDIDSSSNIPIMFGDFRRGYGIRDVMEARMQRLDELYAERRRVGFIAWVRSGGRPLFSSTIAATHRPIRGIITT